MNIEQPASVASVVIDPMEDIKKTVDRLNDIIAKMISDVQEKCCTTCSC